MAWPLRKLSTHTDNINEVVIRSSAKLSMISTYNFVIHILHSHNPIDPRGKTLENGCLLLSHFIYLSSYQLYTFNLKIDYCNSYWKSFGIFFEIETDKNPTKFVWLLAINDDISFVTFKDEARDTHYFYKESMWFRKPSSVIVGHNKGR